MTSNWARTFEFSGKVVRPGSIDELLDLVADQSPLHPIGTRHSFSRVADGPGRLVDLSALPESIDIDAAAHTVRVSAGTRYAGLAEHLQRSGWALANLASLPHISVAGSTATGTHGSGDGVGSLATAVAALEIVTGDGAARRMTRGDAEFAGVVVGLGAFGIVTALELDIEPSFEVAQTVFDRVPLDRVLDDLAAVTGLAYSTSMFISWNDPDVVDQLWLKRRIDTDPPAPAEVLGAPAADGPRHPIPGMGAESTTAQGGIPGPWHERLPHFRPEFSPSAGDEIQSEFLVPRENAAAALDSLRRHSTTLSAALHMSEVRTVAADQLWLSGAYGTDVVGIHLTWRPDPRAVDAALALIEPRLLELGARPHWGKVFRTPLAEVRELYPRMRDVDRLAALLDPRGVFRNAFLDELLAS